MIALRQPERDLTIGQPYYDTNTGKGKGTFRVTLSNCKYCSRENYRQIICLHKVSFVLQLGTCMDSNASVFFE